MNKNEVINNNAENKDATANVSAENLEFLELLLTDKNDKTREYDKAKKHIQELITSESNDEKKFKTLVGLILKGDIQIVKGFFEQEWQNLSPENKELTVNELLVLPAEKGTTRQATAAHSIAAKDGDTAARIIFHIIASSKQGLFNYDYSLISNEKRDVLRSRFFPQNGAWHAITSPDEQVLRALILFFSELVEEVKDFGKQTKAKPGIKLEIDFVDWLSSSMNKLNFDNETSDKLERRLNRMINRLPKPLQDQFKQKKETQDKPAQIQSSDFAPGAQKTVSDTSQQIARPIAKQPLENNVSSQENKPDGSASKKEESKELENSHKKNPEKSSGLSTPEQLLKEKQTALAQLSGEIEVLSKLIAERDSLLSKQKDLQKRLDSAYDETEKSEEKLKKLRENFDEIESVLTQMTGERDKAVKLNKELSEELSSVKKELEHKNKSLESERSEFAQSSKQEVEFEIENFKGSLRQKLRPIFENKRQTDSDPNHEKLAEFLRRWFDQIEEVLKKSGINP